MQYDIIVRIEFDDDETAPTAISMRTWADLAINELAIGGPFAVVKVNR